MTTKTKNTVCIISGPTASGKTSTSIALAKKFGGEIVNFDSLLFYQEITIGTAKPTIEEQDGVVHHMIDNHSLKEPLNAAQYIKEALPIVEKLLSEDKIVFLVGGSGFYLQALLYGMFESKTTSKEVIEKSEQLYQKAGIEPFIEILKENDHTSFEQYHANDHYRVRRAVEHFWSTGEKLSDSRKNMDARRQQGPMLKNNWNVFNVYLDLPKEQHWEIIQQRTKQMLQDGLVQEVEYLLNNGHSGEEKPLNSIGYKETVDFIRDKFENEEDYIERINISTRQLAKSQRTWFKKLNHKVYHPLDDKKNIEDEFQLFLKK